MEITNAGEREKPKMRKVRYGDNECRREREKQKKRKVRYGDNEYSKRDSEEKREIYASLER